MRNHWAAGAIACALIATFSANISAQTPAPASAQAPTPVDNLAAWGPYARLAGQSMYDPSPEGRFWVRWRWETPGQALVMEWYRTKKNSDKPAATAVLRLGAQPGTLVFKGNFLMGKEWDGTLNDDGSVSYVGKGMLKLRYTVRIDEQGNYEETYSSGYVVRYAAAASSGTPVAVAQTSPPATPAPEAPPTPAPSPVVATPTPAPAVPEKPTPVAAKLQPTPPAKPIKAPNRLTEDDTQRIWQSVQQSRARSLEQARQNELARQEAARQAAIQQQIWAAERARQEAEEAEAEAEFEAERQQKAAAWNAMAQANEQALNNSLQNLRDTTARIQAQQAQSQSRPSAPADPLGAAERQRQVELINQANRRQDDIAAGYAAQQKQYEQPRVDTPPSFGSSNSQQRSQDAGHASTDTDANRCVTSAEVRVNDTTQGNTAAYVTNGCGTTVSMKICLMTETGWKCGVNGGVHSQASWSYSAFHATGPVFVDAKVADSNRPHASPN